MMNGDVRRRAGRRVCAWLIAAAAAGVLSLGPSQCAEGQEGTVEAVSSPNGKISVFFFSFPGGEIAYAVDAEGRMLIRPSSLGFRFRDQPPLVDAFKVRNIDRSAADETWEPVWGTSSKIENRYNEMTVHLIEQGGLGRKMDVVFKVFDDGVAFRYVLPEQPSLGAFDIISEETSFCLNKDWTAWWIPNDWDSYEHLYRETPLSSVTGANTPLTLETYPDLYVSIHEADLTDYAGMTLVPGKSGTDAPTLRIELVPWPDGVTRVVGSTPFVTPWRVVQIAKSPGALLESNLILNLNEPCAIEDTSWIHPMKYVGVWWGMHIGRYTWHEGPRHGATTENVKRYIDFAADRGIDAVLVEGWNTGWDKWGAKGAYDYVTPYGDFDLEEVTAYARKKGVAIIGHHETGGDAEGYEELVDRAFDLYDRVGIPAVKTGYAGGIYPRGQHHHGQWMVQHYRSIVKKAAQHHLMLDVHEPIADTGVSRTYPNMMTREGVRGTEYNAWSEGNPPEHTTILPFTRMLSGPLDYTPGIFDLTFSGENSEHRVRTTLANQLALYVVLFSPLQMAADMIENYDDHPAFAFIESVPVTWDETRGLDCRVGDYAAVARRSGDNWFLGAVTDENGRTLTVPLDFLDGGRRYEAHVFRDADDADWEANPTAIEIETREVSAKDAMDMRLAPGGGQAIWFSPVAYSGK
jgi:alpha-glucosidase